MSLTSETLAELLPFSGKGDKSDFYEDSESKEWWYVFALQLLLWWSLWSSLDSIAGALGAATWNQLTVLHLYLLEIVLGSLVYFVPFPVPPSEPSSKLKRFIGMVLICCGLWNLLDSFADFLASLVGFPPALIYVAVLLLTATLGGVHHYKYRANYLIDRLM